MALPADDDGATVPELVRDLVGLGVRVHAVEPARISLEERLLGILRHADSGGDRDDDRTVLTIAGLTLREASRRKVLRALAVLTVALLGASAWGFSKLAAGDRLRHADQRRGPAGGLAAAQPGHVRPQPDRGPRDGVPRRARRWPARSSRASALAVLARPVRRSAVLLGKWLGPGRVRLRLRRRWPGWRSSSSSVSTVGLLAAGTASPGSRCSPAQTIVLLTLALLLSTVVSPMASGIVAVGLFGATWVAGVVGGIGAGARQRGRRAGRHRLADAAAHRRPVARGDARLPGPHRAAASSGGELKAFPFLSPAGLTAPYLVWAAVWVAMVWGLAAASFLRKDL